MSARVVVSLWALVVEDCARTAARVSGYSSAARLLRRLGVDDADIAAAASDLRGAASQQLRTAGRALNVLAGDARGAAELLADHCGLDLAAWIAESCAEQGVELGEEVTS